MHKCNVCNKAYKYESELIRHFNSKLHQCLIKECGIGNISNSDNSIDIGNNDNTEISEDTCKHCNKSFCNKYVMIRHMKKCNVKIVRENKNKNKNTTNTTNSNTTTTNATNINAQNLSDIEKLFGKKFNAIEKEDIIKVLVQITNFMNKDLHQTNDDEQQEMSNQSNETIPGNKNISGSITFNSILGIDNNNTDNSSNVSTTVENSQNTTNMENSYNTTNTINNTNSHNNNVNITNNYNIIYPHGLENINFLNENEMLYILKNSDNLVKVFEKIFSKIENKNFHKRNLNKDNVTYIDKKFEIKVSSEKQFKKMLIDNLLIILQRIFFHCKNNLSIKDQIIIWKNIRGIEKNTKMNSEEIADAISNMMIQNIEYKSFRDYFIGIKGQLDETKEFKEYLMKNIKETKEEINKFYKELGNITLTKEILKDEIWNVEENTYDYNLDNEDNDINITRLDDTPRYKIYQNMIIEELAYLSKRINTLGDIDNYVNIRDRLSYAEYDELITRYNPSLDIRQEILEKLITNPQSENKYKLRNVKFENNTNTNSILN